MQTDSQTIPFLTWLYGGNYLLKNSQGNIFPASLKRLPALSSNQLSFQSVTDIRKFPKDSIVLQSLKKRQKHVWNGQTYVFHQLKQKQGQYLLEYSLGNYFDMLNTCGVLEKEIQDLTNNNKQDFSQIYNLMENRRRLHNNKTGEQAFQDVWRGFGRSSAIGVSCLFVIKSMDSYYYILRRRSENVAEDSGLIHIIPSLIFQPAMNDDTTKMGNNLLQSVLREIGEELFSREETNDSENRDAIKNTYPEIECLEKYLETGQAEFVITGLSVNLLNMRQEILTTLIVHNSNWHEKFSKDYCFSPLEYVSMDEDSNSGFIDLYDHSAWNGESPKSYTVECAACLEASLKKAREICTKHLQTKL